MSARALRALPGRKRLAGHDQSRLRELLYDGLPQMLQGLALAMLETGEKGEQEGYL